jgi:hypothetical protein
MGTPPAVRFRQPLPGGGWRTITGLLLGEMHARGQFHHYRALAAGVVYLLPRDWVVGGPGQDIARAGLTAPLAGLPHLSPPSSDEVIPPTRRGLLCAAALTAALPLKASARAAFGVRSAAEGASNDPPRDADLIAACNEYLRIERAFDAHCRDVPGDIEDDDPAVSMLLPLRELTEVIVASRAVTAEGHLARARCAAFHTLPGSLACRDNPAGGRESRFRAAALRDLVHAERGDDA